MARMTHRARVLAAIDRQETDRYAGCSAFQDVSRGRRICPFYHQNIGQGRGLCTLNGTQYSGTGSPGKHCGYV